MNTKKTVLLEVFIPEVSKKIPIPAYESFVAAGFPSPADDFLDRTLDLHELLIKHPVATFFVRVVGDSMRDAEIQSGDILIVDRSLEPSDGKIVVAVLNGEFTVKRLRKTSKGEVLLIPENDTYPTITVHEESDFQVWGVVTYVIHKT